MNKIFLTNSTELLDSDNIKYDKVYTDSPYLVEYFNDAIYLDTLLDKNFNEDIDGIRKKGYEINSQIINIFFPNYKNRHINILSVKIDFTNIFINIVKLFKLIDLYPNDEITIGITEEELYNYNSPEVLQGIENRFGNIYYLIVELAKIKNIKLICHKVKKEKKAPEYRSKEERQSEVKHVLEQLNEYQLNTKFEPVKKLYIKFKEYIGGGERLIVNIPFPEINRRIKGVLAINKREDVTIALLNEKF